jgi:hypothetical protein
MGLYLCVFASEQQDDEIDGVEVGGYDDFSSFRTAIAESLEAGEWGSRFPTLMMHADSDGVWSVTDCRALADELRTIEVEAATLPPHLIPEDSWQAGAAKTLGLAPTSLADSYFDVDGEPLLGRLQGLVEVAIDVNAPIWFQ